MPETSGETPTGTTQAPQAESQSSTPTTTLSAAAPPVPAPPAGESDEAALRRAKFQECEDKADRAIVAFPQDLVMTVGESALVTVVARLPDTPTPEPSPDSTAVAPPTTVVEEVDLTCFVVATLSGSRFGIENQRQTGDFLDAPRIDWTWSVTALEAGDDLQMLLRITPRIVTPDGGFEDGTPRGPFIARIDVEAKPQSVWSQFTAGLASILDHPLFRGFIPFVTIAGLLLGYWRKALRRPWPWSRDPEEAASAAAGAQDALLEYDGD